VQKATYEPVFLFSKKYPVKSFLAICGIIAFACFSFYCSSSEKASAPLTYLNLNDTVGYVGMETCKQCHTGIHASFSETGMGKSFGSATRSKSAADFSKKHHVYDKELDLWYTPSWIKDSLFITEYRLNGSDTVHKRMQKIQYVIGSGQHTNSHLFSVNGYLFQAPLTYYTQAGRWDLPPGFEKGKSQRFDRLIGLECMSCHNGYPQMVKGSENKYLSLPGGIDCERCHGPGEIHVAEKQQGILVDTSKAIDYTIVNPGKLPVDLQFDLCQRCHLQGNAVLKEGKSFFDFKPGMALKEVMQVYLPSYEGDEKSFIMASHADRLKQSQCFQVMEERNANRDVLRPYKNALTCVTCHNPHVSVKKTGDDYFIQKCKSCHTGEVNPKCSEKPELQLTKQNNCISCHMPLSGSIDIPHVRIHDHFIRKKPEAPLEVTGKKFKGLRCINDPKPDRVSIAKAYLQHYEKFGEGQMALLDSAEIYLDAKLTPVLRSNFAWLVQLHYLRKDFSSILQLVASIGIPVIRNEMLQKKSWSNQDAWTAYRIGEAYASTGQWSVAFKFYGIAYSLAPHYFEFANKYGSAAMQINQQPLAKQVFQKLTVEVPGYAPGWSNLGYLCLLEGFTEKAEAYYSKAISLDPDYIAALMNMVGLYLYQGDEMHARQVLTRILKIDPKNLQAQTLLTEIKDMSN
jgi:TPR repeat protein